MSKTVGKPLVLVAFGVTVRKLRMQAGFSQEAFADACEIDRSYMGGVERGERNLSLVNIDRIIKGLGIQPSVFFRNLDADQLNGKLQKQQIQREQVTLGANSIHPDIHND